MAKLTLAWLRALRPEHWAKNLLLFVPLGLGLPLVTAPRLATAGALFVAFSLLASATYILNDLLDLETDRAHPTKAGRPFAAGVLPVAHGVVAALVLLTVVAGIAARLPIACSVALAAYLITTLAYSVFLKRQPFLDVILLAGLFTLRLLAGSVVLEAPVSPWLMTFSMLFFTSLAMIKRHAELQGVARSGGNGIDSRGYTLDDLPLLLAAGIGCGIAAITVFMIYLINEQYPRQQYAHPQALWAMMPVLLVWFLRMWHVTIQGRMTEDPVIYALRDRVSLGLGVLVLAILFTAVG